MEERTEEIENEDQQLSLPEVLERLEIKLSWPSSKTKHYLINQLIKIDAAQLEKESETKITNALFSILFIPQQRASEKLLENLISHLAQKGPTFLKIFAAQVIKVSTGISKNPFSVSLGAKLLLFRWSCLIIQNCTTNLEPLVKDKNNTPFTTLASQQINLLHAITDSENIRPKLVKSLSSTFSSTIKKRKQAFEHYINTVTQAEPSLQLSSFVGFLFAASKSHSDLFNKYQPQFVELYSKIILSSSTKPTKANNQAFTLIIKSFNEEQFSGVIMNTLNRVMKRNPEVVISSISHLVGLLSFDLGTKSISLSNYPLGKQAPALISLLQPHMQSNNEAMKEDSNSAFRSVINKTADFAVLETLVKEFLKALKAKPPNWYERAGLTSAIQYISTRYGKDSVDQTKNASTTVVNALLDYVETEANDEARAAGMTALAIWITLLNSLPDKAVKIYTTGVNSDKEGLKISTLDSLFLAASALDSKLIGTIYPNVVKIVKTSKSGIDAIYAFRLLLRLAAKDPAIGEKLTSEKLYGLVLKSDSFLFKPAMINKLNDRDLQAITNTYEILLSQYSHLFPANPDDLSVMFSTLITVITHANEQVRKYGIKALQSVHDSKKKLPNNISISDTLLNYFFQFVNQQISNKDATPISPSILSTALVAVVSSNIDSKLGLALLLANHSYIAHDAKVYLRVLRRVGDNSKQVVSDKVDSISSLLLSKDGLDNDNLLNREAAVSALAHLASVNSEVVVPFIISAIQSRIIENQKQISALTPIELGIYNTPEGQLYQDISELLSKQQSQQAQGARSKARRGESRMNAAEEDKWEIELRKELEKKKKEGDNTEQKLKEEQLAKEKAIRDRVISLVRAADSNLLALSSIADLNKNAVHDQLSQLIQTLMSLLRSSTSKLVGNQICSTLEHLGKCLYSKLQPHFKTIAAAIYVPYGYSESSSDMEAVSGIIDKVISEISDEIDGILPSNSLSFIFPVLKAALMNNPSVNNDLTVSIPVGFASQDSSLSILELHTKPGLLTKYPRRDMISVFTHVMTSAPRLQQRAKEALLELCSGISNPSTDEYSSHELFELLKGLYLPQAPVRLAILQALERIPSLVGSQIESIDKLSASLWYARFDIEGENAKLADKLWNFYKHSLPENYFSLLSHTLGNSESSVQEITAKSIAGAVKLHPGSYNSTLSNLTKLYTSHYPIEVNGEEKKIDIDSRRGVALTFGAMASVSGTSADQINTIFSFLLNTTLLDRDESIRQRMTQAGLDIIAEQGQSHHSTLLPIFESNLNKQGENVLQDRVRESIVIFMGGVAKHLDSANPKLTFIIDKLIDTLRTPSESVQKTVSKSLIGLMPLVGDRAEKIANQLLETLQGGASYGERRGAAYGVAALVKGLGIASLKKYNIMNTLQEAVEDKKRAFARQGALFAFECLCNTLERLFEPYVIQILPKLLTAYGDSVNDVRDAAADTSKAIMSQLSAHGVKLVLPALLKALEDRNWRTKIGSVNLIGSMAFCAPRQLAATLPTIVPRLSSVLTDSHAKVVEAAREALEHIGSVIRNPEIQVHVPVLLKALDNPGFVSLIKEALDALIHTNFVHTIDAPSLSLIIPALHRALRDRNADTKKKASQIVGNMCSLTEHKDLEPYLDTLVNDLKLVIVDPIPEVRAVASKALGSLMKGLGEDTFNANNLNIIPWLLDTMKSDAGSVERSGAAQGLSEVLAALDISKFDSLLPDVIANAAHVKPYAREGFIGLFVFLPFTITKDFQRYLSKVLPSILAGLSDENEAVRDVSLRAGQAIVNQYAQTALPLLLPAIEEGLFNDNWRIRQSSVQLLGDLLHRIISKHPTPEEDPGKIITQALGIEKRNIVLAALYMIRSDVSSVVRQKALLVWKTVVSNTPRTLKEILPSLMLTLIDSLGSSNVEKRQVAGKTLGDLVAKLGDKILPEIIPILEKGLDSPKTETRQGVCLGLSEVMGSVDKNQLITYLHIILPSIRKALCDNLVDVREAAAQAFDMVYKNIGEPVLDEILPPLLAALQDETKVDTNSEVTVSHNALDGLKQLLSVRSNVVLPFLVPKLLTPPITTFNVKALASVAEVSGPSLNQHLPTLVPALIQAVMEQSNKGGNDLIEIRKSTETIILSVQVEGVYFLLNELIKQMDSTNPRTRAVSCDFVNTFCGAAKIPFETMINPLIQALLARFGDESKEVLTSAWGALASVTNAVKKENIGQFLPFTRGLIGTIREDYSKKSQTTLPGFCLPKGIQPVLPLFLNGLLYGSSEVREQAASGLGDIIELTSDDALKPFVIQITGPLIRVIGDRFTPEVKSAILQTLNLLIIKGGLMLKPFTTQLQTTFIKSLSEPNRNVRFHAAKALGSLMTILSARIDSLVNELLTGINSAEGGVQEAMLSALRQVLLKVGANIPPEVMAKLGASLLELLGSEEESIRVYAAKTIGAYSKFLNPTALGNLVNDSILSDGSKSWQLRHGSSVALTSLLHHNPTLFTTYQKPIIQIIFKYLKDDKVPVKQSIVESVGEILLQADVASAKTVVDVDGEKVEIVADFLNKTSDLLNDESSDVKVTVLRVIKKFAKAYPTVTKEHLNTLVQKVFGKVKERTNLPVKLAAERTLMHVLQVHTNPKLVDEYCATLDSTNGRALGDYCKRILAKLSQDSESEEDEK